MSVSKSQSLASSILQSALPLVRTHSFTHPALLAGYGSLLHASSSPATSLDTSSFDSAKPRAEDVLRTIFGPGERAGEKLLVAAWEQAGLENMRTVYEASGSGGSIALAAEKSEITVTRAGAAGTKLSQRGDEESMKRVGDVMKRRLRYSSERAGEHLTQAYALLATPNSTPSFTVPQTLTSPLSILYSSLTSSLRLPPAYHPPYVGLSSTSTLSNASDTSLGSGSDSRSHQSGTNFSAANGITLPLVNPIGVLRYADRIADEALDIAGGEAEGGGLDWYSRRIFLSLIYLHAESHLLSPRPQSSHAVDPFLAKAYTQLDTSLARYRKTLRAEETVGVAGKQWVEFGGFVWKSWGGLFRSRGWIN